MRNFTIEVLAAALLTGGCASAGKATAEAAARSPSADARFRVETVVESIARPWSINFAPDGRLFYTQRDAGSIGVLHPETREIRTLISLSGVRAEGEAGLLGLELDPEFSANGSVYVCYSTRQGETPINRVSRFTYSQNKLSGEKNLIEMPSGILHAGCRLAATPDGFLFISMGEGFEGKRSQDLKNLGGKILRIKTDGSIPSDNPFPGSAVWTYGHRNPQGLAFQPGTGKLWSTEHGPETDDELNLIKKGLNYGWPNCRGESKCFGKYEPAVKSYYPQETVAISDMVFYTGEKFPEWKGNILFVTLKTGRLYRVVLEGEPDKPKVKKDEILIDGTYGRLRDVTVGPEGSVYIATEGSILRISPK